MFTQHKSERLKHRETFESRRDAPGLGIPTIAGMMRSLKTGRLYFAMSMIEISGLDVAGEESKTLCTKSTTVGPARIPRVLEMMRATFFAEVEAMGGLLRLSPRSESGRLIQEYSEGW